MTFTKTTTRRIRKELLQFFNAAPLEEKDRTFIESCLKSQQRHPQLTSRQWEVVQGIYQKYKI